MKPQRTVPCSSCGRPIKWAGTSQGKWIPLDPDPHPQGNVMIRFGQAIVTGPSRPPPPDAQLYMPHWATCPNADSHRAPTPSPPSPPPTLFESDG